MPLRWGGPNAFIKFRLSVSSDDGSTEIQVAVEIYPWLALAGRSRPVAPEPGLPKRGKQAAERVSYSLQTIGAKSGANPARAWYRPVGLKFP
jgi:hypothetical protein